MDKIKTHLTNAYMMFVLEFHDPSAFDQKYLLVSLPGKLENLFDTQKQVDRAKKTFGREGFKKILSLYFNQFQSNHGLSIDDLDDQLVRNKKTLLRHLGKDKFMFLSLIVILSKAINLPSPKKRGLLFERASA